MWVARYAAPPARIGADPPAAAAGREQVPVEVVEGQELDLDLRPVHDDRRPRFGGGAGPAPNTPASMTTLR